MGMVAERLVFARFTVYVLFDSLQYLSGMSQISGICPEQGKTTCMKRSLAYAFSFVNALQKSVARMKLRKVLIKSKNKKKPVVQKILIISHTALGSRSFCHRVWTGWILLFYIFSEHRQSCDDLGEIRH